MWETRRRQGTHVAKHENEWLQIFARQSKEFCLSTGLHGYKYIAQEQRSKTERMIWGVVVLSSLCISLGLMWIAWDYNTTHPTLTVIDSTHHGIWNYPFPAVTVCDINRVSRNLAEALVRDLETPFDDSHDYIVAEMRLLNELLVPGLFGYNVESNLTYLQDIFELNNLTIHQVMRLVTRNCSDLITVCKWKGVIQECDSLFQQTLTREGLCCSFNYFGLNAFENLSSVNRDEPRRVTACGYQTGLTMVVNPEPEDYHATILGAYGVEIMVHDPYDYPDYNSELNLVGTGLEVFMSVSPEDTYSTEGVRQLPVAKRDCIFAGERSVVDNDDGSAIEMRNLSTRRYSYHNCLAQCRATTVRAKCGCIPYYYPQNGTRACDLRDLACMEKYTMWHETSWPGVKVSSKKLPLNMSNGGRRPCGCLPDCALVRYLLESSAGIFDQNNSYNDIALFDGVEMRNHSMVHVFFSDLVSTQYRRDEYYNWHNLFASFGGLLGLFAGFSLMSGFELIYFFSIRIIADICMKKSTIVARKT